MHIHKNNSGFGLIEVLVVLILLGVGILALTQTQVTAMRLMRSAYWRSLALNQAQNLAELTQVLPAKTLINSVTSEWNQDNARLLPQGEGDLSQRGQTYVIKVRWHEPNQGEGTACVQLPVAG